MKKILAAVLLVLCANGAYAGPAERTVERDYVHSELRYGVSPLEAHLKGINTFKFKPEPGERWVSISVEDDVIENVSGTVWQYVAVSHTFCGSTAEPVPIVPDKPVTVRIGRGSCDAPNVYGTGTHVKGTVTVTFTR